MRKQGNRQNMRQGESVGSSSRAGGAAGSAGPSSREGGSRPRKSAAGTPAHGERRSNPARELNCIYPTCKAACEGSVVSSPCGPPLLPSSRLLST